MLCVKIGIGQVPVDFCVCPRYTEADSSKHVVSSDPIDVVLIDFGANNDALIVFISLSLARSLLLNMLGPPYSIVIRNDFVEVCI